MYNECQQNLHKLLLSQKTANDKLYNALANELSTILKPYKVKSKSGVWVRNSEIEKKVDAALVNFHSAMLDNIEVQSSNGWELANKCNDALVDSYTKGMSLTEAQTAKMYLKNEDALNAFLKRKAAGLNLSQRVWKIADQSKEQLELLLESGVTEGRSAAKLATDLKQYLKEPDKRFRRVRNSKGKLVYSDPAKNYKSGQGVYRSSYKNALRLSRNEINIANKAADYERRKNLDFVLGVKVNLSASHPEYDICDEMVGVYPKGFKFVGWHPNCLCYTTSVNLSKEEFIKKLKGGTVAKSKYVTEIPKRAEKYLNENASTIKNYSNKPYFISDNFKNTKDGFALKSDVKVK